MALRIVTRRTDEEIAAMISTTLAEQVAAIKEDRREEKEG